MNSNAELETDYNNVKGKFKICKIINIGFNRTIPMLKSLSHYYITFLFGCIVFLGYTGIAHSQTWQEKLGGYFDVVETFDQLQDWHTTKGGNPYGDVTDKSDMPKKLDGSNSIWEYYSFWGSSSGTRPYWIANFGSDKVWQGTGKSLCIDYGESKGPSRLAFSIGNSPADGYEEAYIFYMIKINKEFFPRSGNSFSWFGYFKTIQIDAGFRDVFDWGTATEQSKAENTPQVRNIYGLHDMVMNWQPYGGHLVIQYNTSYSNSQGTNWIDAMYGVVGEGADFSSLVLANDWFAIEYHAKLSNPHGSKTGLIEIWLYDKNGNIKGHDIKNNIITLADATNWAGGGNHVFNHRINKFVWGGNRYDEDFGNCESHCYIDDIIVDDNRIGLEYFSLLNNTSVADHESDDNSQVTDFQLRQNYPNPFNNHTTIQYALPKAADVRLDIYNATGQLIKQLVNENQSAGNYQVSWNGTNNEGMSVASGLYFYVLSIDNEYQVQRKMVYLK